MKVFISICVLLWVQLSSLVYAADTEFTDIFNKSPITMLLIEPGTGAIVDVNPAAQHFYGYSRSAMKKMTIQQINTLSDKAIASERQLARKENRNYFIFSHQLSNKQIRTVEVYSIPVSLDGRTLLFSTIHDISNQREKNESQWHYQSRLEQVVSEQVDLLSISSIQVNALLAFLAALMLVGLVALSYLNRERKKVSQAYAEEKRRLKEIIKGTNAGTWEWHIPTGEILINERWAEMIGYDFKDVSPSSIEAWEKVTHPDDVKKVKNVLGKYFDGEMERYECEFRMRHKEGHWIWVIDRGKIVERDDLGHPLRMAGTHQDITDKKQINSQLEFQAHHDLLTSLPNRGLFYDRFSYAISAAKRDQYKLATLFIDLDGFKSINDTLGHDAGDQVLIEVAKRIPACLRETDTVARMGGDEFAVLLTQVRDVHDIGPIADNLIAAVAQPYKINQDHQVNITCSIGISLYPVNGLDANTLVQSADTAMYRAKLEGKNCYILAPNPLNMSPKEIAE